LGKVKKEMNTTLTLTLEEELFESASKYAEERGQSLSELVENYLRLITSEGQVYYPDQLSDRVRRMRGMIAMEPGANLGDILEEELGKKFDD